MSGQLTVYNTEDPKINILESRLQDQEPFFWDTDKSDSIKAGAPPITIDRRIRFGSLISFNEETSYINIHAIEKPHMFRLQRLLGLNGFPAEGNSIVISESVAKDLKCSVGDTVLLVADNINDYMSDEIAVVTEIFEERGLATMLSYTGFTRYDFGAGIVQLADDECLELIINPVSNVDFTKEEIARIRQKLNTQDENLKLSPWDETVPFLFRIVNVWKGGGYFTQTLFIVFSLMILVNLVSLIIDSRKKEFGTLLAIGFSWKKILLLVSLEYLIITLTSVCLSCGAISVLIAALPENGIYIASKDMQSALMAEYLKFQPYISDFLYTLSLFCATTLIAVLISISRVKHLNSVVLINKN